MGMANQVDITLQEFGELRAIRCVGVRRAGKDRRRREWLFECIEKQHPDIRTLTSVRVTGEKTACKQCRKERRQQARTVRAEKGTR